MKTGKKLGMAILAVTTALCILLISAYALFSDQKQGGVSGTIGTMNIDMTDVNLSNKENINPGDYDPNNPDCANPGTHHDLTFNITNNGNKSADLRNIIVITVLKEDGSFYDPTVFSLFTEKASEYAKAGTELTDKFYRIAGSDELKSALAPGDVVEAVVYITSATKTVNGIGNAAEIERNVNSNSADFEYYLVMDRNADNSYQGLAVNIDVIAQAKQHRNSNNDDWATIMTKTVTINGLDFKIVPAANEDANGNLIP